MNKIYILCVDDDDDVLDVVIRELAPFENAFPLETASSAHEARRVLASIKDAGDRVGLIFCDHIMPGENGVELLVELQQQEAFRATRKVLLTGQAGLEATVKAVNQADLAHYVAKPWSEEELRQVARRELSRYLVACELNPTPYLAHLDMSIVGPLMREMLDSDR